MIIGRILASGDVDISVSTIRQWFGKPKSLVTVLNVLFSRDQFSPGDGDPYVAMTKQGAQFIKDELRIKNVRVKVRLQEDLPGRQVF